jgi:hypothetical protein
MSAQTRPWSAIPRKPLFILAYSARWLTIHGRMCLLNPAILIAYTFKYDGKFEGGFYVVDESRQLRFEVNTDERRIYWQPIGQNERHRLYDIIVLL